MNRTTAGATAPAALLALTLVLASHAGYAALTVDGSVRPVAPGVWEYAFTVTNGGPADVIIVSLVDAPLGDAQIELTLVAPPAYLASYDAGLGFVDFLEDTALFAVGTDVVGFAFQSAAAPFTAFTAFEAYDVNLDFIAGDTNMTLVPIPPSLVLAGSGIALLHRRRAR